ncbi:MAG: TIGR04282 family arsenosugar biosynthesis glycosyltransferase [Opitutaceae bacterium]
MNTFDHPASPAPSFPTVLAFLKAPKEGEVKTRLARAIGTREALEVYRTLAGQQLTRIPRLWPVRVLFTPDDAGDVMRAWLGNGRIYEPQGSGDLGARLRRAFASAFAAGAPRVLAIGGDCPTLRAADLECARDGLETVNVVIGPARDGGYYLIGLDHPRPELFNGIRWSTPDVCAETLRRIHRSGLTCKLLDEKEDVDDLASWQRHRTGLGPADRESTSKPILA